jgi:hypothetical protein
MEEIAPRQFPPARYKRSAFSDAFMRGVRGKAVGRTGIRFQKSFWESDYG